jgi:hypothetical protein
MNNTEVVLTKQLNDICFQKIFGQFMVEKVKILINKHFFQNLSLNSKNS